MTALTSMSSRNYRLTTAFVCLGILVFAFLHLHTSKFSDWHLRGGSMDSTGAVAGAEEDLSLAYETSPLDDENDDFRMSAARLPHELESSESFTPQASKVAVIIEDRKLNTLVPLILHFASILGPTWEIVLYTSLENSRYYASMPAFLRWRHQIDVRPLPEENMFTTHESVSAFLTKPWIWESLAPAKHVFMFQADSIICGNSIRSVDEFLGYDFIGAPVREGLGRGYNGGLSLRNREKMLEIVQNYDWLEERHIRGAGDGYAYQFEDQWFAMRLSNMPGALMPTVEIANEFAVETIWAENSLGYHQISRWQESHMAEVTLWCPEIALSKGAAFIN